MSVSHVVSKLRLFPHWAHHCWDLQREDGEVEERGEGGGAGKEPELAALNKGNFPAIWLAFRKEEKVLEAGAATVRKLLFIF